jgi:hypothetical protein
MSPTEQQRIILILKATYKQKFIADKLRLSQHHWGLVMRNKRPLTTDNINKLISLKLIDK